MRGFDWEKYEREVLNFACRISDGEFDDMDIDEYRKKVDEFLKGGFER